MAGKQGPSLRRRAGPKPDAAKDSRAVRLWNAGYSASEIAGEIGGSTQSAWARLQRLVRDGVIAPPGGK